MSALPFTEVAHGEGFYLRPSFRTGEPMIEEDQINPTNGKPSRFDREVYAKNQFQLPACLVNEVGSEGGITGVGFGAKVVWYYHRNGNKAVLAHEDADRPSLEPVGASSLTNISNDDLKSGVESDVRVTILNDLPEQLYDQLTRDKVVLRPLYADDHPSLDHTYVSVYPAAEYYQAKLGEVDVSVTVQEDQSSTVTKYENFADSV
jgi:hypothetical protein